MTAVNRADYGFFMNRIIDKRGHFAYNEWLLIVKSFYLEPIIFASSTRHLSHLVGGGSPCHPHILLMQRHGRLLKNVTRLVE